MNSDPIDRRTLLTRLAAAFAALPALAMKGHAAATGSPPSGTPDKLGNETSVSSSDPLSNYLDHTEYRHDSEGRVVQIVTRCMGSHG